MEGKKSVLLLSWGEEATAGCSLLTAPFARQDTGKIQTVTTRNIMSRPSVSRLCLDSRKGRVIVAEVVLRGGGGQVGTHFPHQTSPLCVR